MTAIPPRLVPERELPRYTYVPGRTPRPQHRETISGGQTEERPIVLPAPSPRVRREFLYGLDLFNHGYYWEAHEVWEDLWHAAGRSGPTADFFKGLIKLAAAGVKSLEGSAVGRRRHALRAAELFARAADGFARDLDTAVPAQPGDFRCLGLSPRALATLANQAAVSSTGTLQPSAQPAAVFNFAIVPGKR